MTMSGDGDASELVRAFDGEPRALLDVGRTLRLALGGVLVFQLLFPWLVPPLWATWIAAPWVTGVPFSVLSRTTYVIGFAPWVLFAAMLVAHGRTLRRAGGFPYDDAQVLWMALVPGYNLYGVWCLLREAGRALERLGGPAGTARDLRWGAGAAIALGALVPIEGLYSAGRSAPPGSELFTLQLLLASARVFVLFRLHTAFLAEPVRRAILAAPLQPAAPAPPPAAPVPQPAPAPATGGPLPARRTLAIGAALTAAGVVVAFGVPALRRSLWEAEVRGLERGSAPPPAHPPANPPARPVRAAAAPSPAPLPIPAAALPARPSTPIQTDRLFGGRTADWWQERIASLRRAPGEEERRLAELTVERARANGLTVREEGGAVRVSPPDAARPAAGGTP